MLKLIDCSSFHIFICPQCLGIQCLVIDISETNFKNVYPQHMCISKKREWGTYWYRGTNYYKNNICVMKFINA